MEIRFQLSLEQLLTLMDVILLPSSLSSSLSLCRKVRCFHPSAHIQSPLPHRFSQRRMSCTSFMCPCWTSWLQCFTVSAGGASTAGGIEHGSLSICRLSQSCTLLPSLPLSPTPLKTVRSDSFLLPCSLSFCTKAHLILHGFLQVNSVTAYFCKCNPS